MTKKDKKGKKTIKTGEKPKAAAKEKSKKPATVAGKKQTPVSLEEARALIGVKKLAQEGTMASLLPMQTHNADTIIGSRAPPYRASGLAL